MSLASTLEIDNGAPQTQYLSAESTSNVGPAPVVPGSYRNAHSPALAPQGINKGQHSLSSTGLTTLSTFSTYGRSGVCGKVSWNAPIGTVTESSQWTNAPYCAKYPPSIINSLPVIKLASSLARKQVP